MNIAVTGSNGFIAKNLIYRLKFKKNVKIFEVNRLTSNKNLEKIITEAQIIYHFAGVNRPSSKKNFILDNINLTKKICEIILKNKQKKILIFSSSTQVLKNTDYGKSKKKCEKILLNLKKKNNSNILIMRLPNVFGKWCKPNYNSVVSTFCYSIARNKKVKLFNSNLKIKLLYIDDLIDFLTDLKLLKRFKTNIISKFNFMHETTAIKLYEIIKAFEIGRKSLFIPNFKSKFQKDLYSTYISLLPKKKFTYQLKSSKDSRGDFIEAIKTTDAGQVSIIIAKKNKIRGHHFHHSKVEKFFVVKGNAVFKMTNIIDKKEVVFKLSHRKPSIVETIPGWQHYIQNSGSSDLIVLLWSNEVFDANKPDTFKIKI